MEPKGWIEIYQPVIVGLGAVVLGLLANAGLEWWRAYLDARRKLSALRNALYLELVGIQRAAANSVARLDASIENAQMVGVTISSWIMSCDREKIGALSTKEVAAIADLISLMEAVLSVSAVMEKKHSHGAVHFLPAGPANEQQVRQFVQQFAQAAMHAKKVFSEKLGI